MKTIEGKAGIKAKIVCDSVSSVSGTRLTTFEVEYPRIIHSELMTHRMLSRNAASSRAIPFAKMKEQLTGRPVRFGEANKGMQDKGEDFNNLIEIETLDGELKYFNSAEVWNMAKDEAVFWADAFYEAGFAKQVFNRLTEPFQMMKTIITATEWDNFFWLRNHEAADPTIAELARCVYEVREQSNPQVLKPGEWHLPYVYTDYADIGNGVQQFYFIDATNCMGDNIPLEDAIKVSCARCAAVSFRNIDYGVEKSREVYERLVEDDRKHASAFEHTATPMQEGYQAMLCIDIDERSVKKERDFVNSVNISFLPSTWEEGVTHVDREGKLWSGNFKGFIQYRKLIPGENYTKEVV